MLRRVGLLIVLLALIVVTTTGAVHAAPRVAGPKPTAESGGILDRLLGWLSVLLHPSSPGVKTSWDADGSHLDPNGNH